MLEMLSKLTINEILTISLTLFAVIDVLGSVPVIISLREKIQTIESGKATLVAGALMLAFLIFGENLLGVIGIDVKSFAIAGSFVIFVIAIEMVLGINIFRTEPDANTGSIVPIAFPIIAGSGTLTTIISLKSTYFWGNILIGILLNLVVVYIVLKSTRYIERKVGKAGLAVARKFFGVILLSIAVKIFKTNLF